MKRILTLALCLSMLLSLGAITASATVSSNVNDTSWKELEFKTLLYQANGDLYSELNEDYWEYWWEGDVPETNAWAQACTVNMRGFAMSSDGRYMYMGTLNGGNGVRGVVVYDTRTCKVTDLYYKYDGEVGLSGNPFSYAKGMAADDRGYVYVGFAFSKNYNIVNLGIAKQQDDGTLEEVYYDAVYEFGAPGDEGGIKVGVNGVDVAKVGDKYYCYFMTNYTYDALYCYDVTDPENPVLNTDFGKGGMIIFSDPSNTVGGEFKLGDGHYMDVDEDGTIWLLADADDAYVMKIAPDGSACVDLIPANYFYCVEHVGGYLILGDYKGEYIEVRDDASYEVIAKIDIPADYGDRVTRIQVINDVVFVCEAGNDNNPVNAVHAAALSADGQAFLDSLAANIDRAVNGEEETTPEETTAETETDSSDETTAEETTQETAEETTDAPTTESSTEAPSETRPEKSGCGATVGLSALAVLLAAAFVVRKKD